MYRKNKNSKFKLQRTPLLWAGIVAVVALMVGGGVFALHSSHTHNSTAQTESQSQKKKSSTDLSPATPSDQANSDSHKQDIVNQQDNPPAKASATPVISYSGQMGNQVEVDASVNGVVEDGGTCTLTATLGSATVTRTVTAVRNAQNTSCPAFIMNRSDFSTIGNWNIQVSYSSANYNGTSQAGILKIQ
jgi:cytoskeletal protein RodZ